ncbi:SAM-dependent methyltransferase [Spirosoma sp. BT704]|uniref:SAM-dependent methyltransferase n=1 Tax=Spirosoma validum TaxID=2771355 RepID=A0A927B497_9BACT|nr:SAM-dependent methyltransferase [Spirosoma validum]
MTDDVRALSLRKSPDGVDLKKIIAQIVARQKAKDKLPTWYANDDLVFPPPLSVEQASSEQTAQYKASLVQGDLLLDLTGGMGVDTWAFAKRVNQVVYVERNPELVELAAHNLPLLGAANVLVHAGDGLELVETNTVVKPDVPADWLYLDPHRRDEQGGKVVRLNDCEPDLSRPQTVSSLFDKANRILIKTSPLLDIDATVRQLTGAVEAVHIVAMQGEVKEILFVLGKQPTAQENVQINAVNLLPNQRIELGFRWIEERTASVTFGDPLRYVYEPNAAVLKAGAFRLIADRFSLTKLAPNSHLYTSDMLRTDFPGRIFAVQEVIKPDSKLLKKAVPTLKANLTVRNFPQSVAELRKKLNLREGGDVYIFATTLLHGDKRLLITQKVAVAKS